MKKIGFVSISHADYINDIVLSQSAAACRSIEEAGYTPIAVADQVTDHVSAVEAGRFLASQGVDGVVLFLASWMECPVFMDVLRQVEHLPTCVWAFPMVEVDGRQESTGAYVSFAMIKGTIDRVGYRCTMLLAAPGSDEANKTLADFCAAASAVASLKCSVLGLVGYTSMSIYTGTFDHVFMRAKIGPEIAQIDSYTLINLAESFSDEERDEVVAMYRDVATIDDDVTLASLRKSAGIYLALKKLSAERSWDAVNVKCQYEFSKEYKMVPCVPLSLLADNGVVASCEGDVLNTVSMMILHLLTGETVTYGDVMNRAGNVFKLSSCGFMPFSMGVAGQQRIRNFMPHPGFTGIQSSFVQDPGRVTVMRLIEDKCDYHILYFTGTGLPTELRQGYMPALDILLDGNGDEFVKNFAGQHYAICRGDVSDRIEQLARMLNIPAVRVRSPTPFRIAKGKRTTNRAVVLRASPI